MAVGRVGPSLRWTVRVLVVGLFLAGTAGAAAASIGAQPPADEEGWVLVHVPFFGPLVTSRWQERGWEVWSAHPEEGVDLYLPRSEGERLVRNLGGGVLRAEQQPTPRWLSCYTSYASVEAHLRDLAGRHPGLVELRDVGPTWETLHSRAVRRRLWAVRITNLARAMPKPVFVVVALHHAREVVTPVLALALADQLASAYDVDPTLTWLLDTSEVWILPVANPDGLIKVEARQNWRKNNDQDACGGQPVRDGRGPGVDLNRNYGYHWGGRGASTAECDETYRGRGPFSEPETQALRDLFKELAPSLAISLHSYSDLVLYPFGYTTEPAPDEAGLRSLARLCASYTGYRPIPVHELYLASGDACDWVYGELGVPCLTFEIGNARENYFWPTCTELAAQVTANLPALVHAGRLVPAPYELALGPLADEVVARVSGGVLRVEARLDDRHSGGQDILAAEYWLDEPGTPGTGQAMVVLPQAEGLARAWAEAPSGDWEAGRRWVFVRGQDGDGHWGPVGAAWTEPAVVFPTPTAPTMTPTPTVTALPPTLLPPVAASPTMTASPTACPTPWVTTAASATPTATQTSPSPTVWPSATPAAPVDLRWRIFAPLVLRSPVSEGIAPLARRGPVTTQLAAPVAPWSLRCRHFLSILVP